MTSTQKTSKRSAASGLNTRSMIALIIARTMGTAMNNNNRIKGPAASKAYDKKRRMVCRNFIARTLSSLGAGSAITCAAAWYSAMTVTPALRQLYPE
jgi:hypothetical protein